MIKPPTLVAVHMMALRLTSSFFAAVQAVYVSEPCFFLLNMYRTGLGNPALIVKNSDRYFQ